MKREEFVQVVEDYLAAKGVALWPAGAWTITDPGRRRVAADWLAGEIEGLRQHMGAGRPEPRLAAALRDAIEEMEDMIGYVPEHFREKWGYDEAIERAKAALR